MARPEGTLKLSSNTEPRMNAPLDARLVVPTKSDLYDFQYYYQGMIVSVKSDDTAYLLVGNDPSQESSWKELGSTGENEGSGSGWGIAKVGTVTGTFDGNGWLQGATVDISGLGVASVDDYEVVLRGASTGSAQIIPYVDTKTTAMFRVGASKGTTGVSEFTTGYIIVAKGFGGGVNSSSWGIAKYGTVNITGLTSTAYRSAPVDLSDLTIASVDDYVILTQPSSADNISYNIESTWCRKESTTQAFIYAYSSSKDSCSVDYVVIAKGYGGGSGDTHHVELTQAEYDALSESEKMNGTVYFITDANPSSSNSGLGIGSGGDTNIIESISVNGTSITPDGNKNVDISIDYPIDSISVNGSPRTPDANGNVDLEIPEVSIQGVKRNGTKLTPDAENNVDIAVPTTLSEVMLVGRNEIGNKSIQGFLSNVPINVPDSVSNYMQGARAESEFISRKIKCAVMGSYIIDDTDPDIPIFRHSYIESSLNYDGFVVKRENETYSTNPNNNENTIINESVSIFSINFNPSGAGDPVVTISEDVRQAFLNALGLAHLAQTP